MKTRTQGEAIAQLLKVRAYTYMEMLAMGISTSPWKRVREYIEMHPEYILQKGTRAVGGDVLVTWRLVK